MTEQQLKEILDSLTIEEKIGQLCQGNAEMFGEDGNATGIYSMHWANDELVNNLGSVLNIKDPESIRKIQENHLKHSKIPLIIMSDIIYGYKTIFPISPAVAGSFDPAAAKKAARITATETALGGCNVTFSPMVDISREARWGRCAESYGEDVLLNSVFGKAVVEGYQGDDLSAMDTIAACVKHYCAYGATPDGKDYNSVEMSERKLRQEYLPAYKACTDAGAAMLMTSFNTINGVPATLDEHLCVDILRDEWGFDGVVISDYASIDGSISEGAMHDDEQAAEYSIKAQIDIDMMDPVYFTGIKKALKSGKLSMDEIDRSVMRILKLKNDMGLMDDPYRYLINQGVVENLDVSESLEVAKQVVCESSVLLKNDGILPLKKSDKVAFIGPFVDQNALYALWSEISPHRLDGNSVKDVIGDKYPCHIGCPILELHEVIDHVKYNSVAHGNEQKYLDEAGKAAENSDYVVMMLGEHKLQFGESRTRSDIKIPDVQKRLFDAIYEVNKNIAVILFCGRPLDISDISKKSRAVLNMWYPGTMGAEAAVEMIFGDSMPSGKLSMTFPQNVGQCPMSYVKLPTSHYSEEGIHDCYRSRYIDVTNPALYPFGHGLTYVDFDYSDIRLSSDKMTKHEKITVSVDVTNLGDKDADESVQLYLHDVHATMLSRPLKELKAFKRVTIPAKSTVTVEFEIDEEMLKYYNRKLEYISEPGLFEVFVGTSSENNKKATFELV